MSTEQFSALEQERMDKAQGPDSWKYDIERIDSMIRYRQDAKRCFSGPKEWEKDYDQYKGIDPIMPNENLIVVNETGSAVDTYLAFLLYNQGKFNIDATRPDSFVSAMIAEEVINYRWKELNIHSTFHKAAFDSGITGSGFLRTGFERTGAQATKNPRKQGKLGTRDYVREGQPFVRRVSPFDMLIDHEAPDYDLESARCCGELFSLPLYEIFHATEDAGYEQQVIDLIKQGHGQGAFAASDSTKRENRNVRKRKYFEKQSPTIQVCAFWDKRYDRHNWYVPNIDIPLKQGVNPYTDDEGKPYLDNLPYVHIPFFYIPDSIYPVGIPRWIRHLQHELNRTRTQMFDYRRCLTTIVFTVLESAFKDPKELEKLEDPVIGEMLIAKVRDAIQAVVVPALPPDVYQIEAKIMGDIERILGLDELARSGRLPSRTSAREIQERSGLTTLKTRPRRNSFDQAAMKVARQMLQHEQAWTDQAQMVKVIGRLGDYFEGLQKDNDEMFLTDQEGSQYIQYTGSDIQGEFGMDMQTMAMGDYDPDMRRAALDKLYATTLQSLPMLAQFEGKVPRMSKFLELLFQEWGIKESRLILPWAYVPAPEEYQQPTGAEVAQQQAMQPQQPTQGGMEEPTPGQETQQGMNPLSGLMGGLMGGAQ